MPTIPPRAPSDPPPAEPGCAEEPHAPRPQASYTPAAFARAAALFRALGDVERLRILEALAQREVCVTELAEGSGGILSTVSQRLRVLRSEGLVVQRREGKHMFYALADQHVVELVRNALDHVSEPPRDRRDPA